MTCRYCFDHISTALLADEVAKRRGGRVIMCDTHEPPREEEVVPSSNANLKLATDETRRLGLKDGKGWTQGKGLTQGKGMTQGKGLARGGKRGSKKKGKRWARKNGRKSSDGGRVLKRMQRRRRLLDDG